MKRFFGVCLILMMLMCMAGCSSEQSATYIMEAEEEGLFSMTDVQSLRARGDVVYELTEVTTLKFGELDAATLDLLVEYYDDTVAALQEGAPEGITVTASYEDRVYIMEMAIDLEKADLQAVSEGGYLVGLDDANGKVKQVSFKQTVEALEASGYTLLKE